MERCVAVIIYGIDVGSKANEPCGSVLRLVVTSIVQRRVLLAVCAGHAEASLFMKVSNHVSVVIISCFVHEIDATLVLDVEVGAKLLDKIKEHLNVLLASQVKCCPAIV